MQLLKSQAASNIQSIIEVLALIIDSTVTKILPNAMPKNDT